MTGTFTVVSMHNTHHDKLNSVARMNELRAHHEIAFHFQHLQDASTAFKNDLRTYVYVFTLLCLVIIITCWSKSAIQSSPYFPKTRFLMFAAQVNPRPRNTGWRNISRLASGELASQD